MAFIKVGGFVLHFQDQGAKEKPALVLSNSLGSDLRIWDSVAERLMPKFRVLRYDLRGHGLSEAPSNRYSAHDLARDIAGLLDTLAIKRAIVGGVSVGGLVAQAFALDFPERACALVLSDTGARIGTTEAWQQRIDKVKTDGVASLVPMTMERWFSADFRARAAADVIGYSLMLQQVSAAGYVGTCAALRDADFRGMIASVKTPALVLCGAEDIATPPQMGRELASLLPGAQFALIEHAAHLPCVEQPAAVADRMMQFFREVQIV